MCICDVFILSWCFGTQTHIVGQPFGAGGCTTSPCDDFGPKRVSDANDCVVWPRVAIHGYKLHSDVAPDVLIEFSCFYGFYCPQT